MAIVATRVTVTSATAVEVHNGALGEIYLRASHDVYVGGSGVSATTGFPLRAVDPPLHLTGPDAAEPIHAIAAVAPSGAVTATVYLLKNEV